MFVLLVPVPLYNLPRMRLQPSSMRLLDIWILVCRVWTPKIEEIGESPHPSLLLHQQWYAHPHEHQSGKAGNRNQRQQIIPQLLRW